MSDLDTTPYPWPRAMRVLALMLAFMLAAIWFYRPAEIAPAAAPPAVVVPVKPTHPSTIIRGFVKKNAATRVGLQVDLYLPESASPTPLVVFIEGGRWSVPDEKMVLGASVADAMQRQGIAVAWLTFELGDAYSLTTCANDVAALVRDLASRSEKYNYDHAHIALAGYGMGASVAAMVALEPGQTAVQRVVAVRGTYDYSDAALVGNPDRALFLAAANDAAARIAASPVAKVREGAPPFLLLSASDDGAEWAAQSHSFMRALERAGASDVQFYMVPNRDPRSILNFSGEGNDLGDLVASFIAAGPTPQPIDGPWGVKQLWTSKPPLDHKELWASETLVVTRPVNEAFDDAVSVVFQGVSYELNVLPGKEYKAIPLHAYLGSRDPAEIGHGEHLVVTNIRGEQLYLTRAEVERLKPQLVIGVDDERNLYRLFTWYRLKQEYSFKAGESATPPTMIRPLGPFLFFPDGVPDQLRDNTLARFGLTADSFHFVEKDPLASTRGSSKELRDVLSGPEGCLKCHALRGEGARAHHVRAVDGKPHGGFALPLEEYPSDVLHRFLFDQETVAASFGVDPLKLSEPVATALEEHVARK